MMIKAVYNAKPLNADTNNVATEVLGKVVYILDIDTAAGKATIAYPVNEDESTFKIVGLGALSIIDENITPLYFAPVPMLKSKRPALPVQPVYEQGTKQVKDEGKYNADGTRKIEYVVKKV